MGKEFCHARQNLTPSNGVIPFGIKSFIRIDAFISP